jgi:spoIIIJ-associated protein
MEPMRPAERRLVHIALADHPDVMTYSIGAGEDRRVVVAPRS